MGTLCETSFDLDLDAIDIELPWLNSEVNEEDVIREKPKRKCNYKSFKCKTCGKLFSCVITLKQHNLKKHKTDIDTGKPYVCDICERSFSFSNSLVRHKMKCSGQKPFSCETCGKGFPNKTCLNTHERSHTNKM